MNFAKMDAMIKARTERIAANPGLAISIGEMVWDEDGWGPAPKPATGWEWRMDYETGNLNLLRIRSD